MWLHLDGGGENKRGEMYNICYILHFIFYYIHTHIYISFQVVFKAVWHHLTLHLLDTLSHQPSNFQVLSQQYQMPSKGGIQKVGCGIDKQSINPENIIALLLMTYKLVCHFKSQCMEATCKRLGENAMHLGEHVIDSVSDEQSPL